MEKYNILVKGIIKYEDKYLVVKRWYDDRILEPFQWNFIDGGIDFGESPEKALFRHVAEQVGMTVTVDRILYTWSFTTGDVFNVGISYLCIATMDNVVLSEELLEHQWITREVFDSYIDKRILDDIERNE